MFMNHLDISAWFHKKMAYKKMRFFLLIFLFAAEGVPQSFQG